MFKTLKNYLRDESGAVTVDWVVLTAGIVVLAATTGLVVHNSTRDTGEQIGTYMNDIADR